jgi:hypothetical protein
MLARKSLGFAGRFTTLRYAALPTKLRPREADNQSKEDEMKNVIETVVALAIPFTLCRIGAFAETEYFGCRGFPKKPLPLKGEAR